MNYRFLIVGGSLLFVSHQLFISDAYAYLDPGTGSAIIQAIFGALVGVGITLKVYWAKIKYKLAEKTSKSKSDK